MMSSGGFRLAAWDYFKWIYVVPLTNSNLRKSSDESIIAAKLTTYSEDNEQYFTFIASEAYYALKDWIRFSHLIWRDNYWRFMVNARYMANHQS
jgi:hypothetical protein